MRVALDMSHTVLGGAGTARYAEELRESLARRGDVDVVTVRSPLTLQRGLGRYASVLAHDLAWYPRGGRRAARDARADVYHIPIARGPLRRGSIPTVITVHDLVLLRNPETMGRWNRGYSSIALPRAVHAADLILVPSADTADDVTRLLRISPERIRIVANGVSERFFGPSSDSSCPAVPYVLFVGTLEPRKNLARLVQAMALRRRRGYEELLIVAGADGWGGVGVGGEPGVEYLGRVDDERLHALYTNASCVALPSLHEGFGLTAIEAMACGTPVAAARSGALPEVCGGAAVLVDPLDVGSIADGVTAAIADRATLASLGRQRARQFSWTAAAEQAVAAYRSIR